MLQNCHALLESPTETGKTLSLLCANLAWRNSLGTRKGKDRNNSDFPLDEQMSHGAFPTIVYASRTHSQLRQVIKELKRCSYRSKEKLNGEEEYNKFVGYMQGLKKKELKLANVMQSVVQLFCGTERDHLLMGFKDFVPVKHRPAYEQ